MADKPTNKPKHDLTTMEGVQAYVEELYSDVGQMLFQNHGLMCTGVFFSKVDQHGHKLDKIIPMGTPLPGPDIKSLRPVIRKGVNETHADGVIVVHAIGRRIVFQMENKDLGDHIWYATPDDNFMLGKLFGPTPLHKFDKDDGFKRLSVIHERYLS